MKSKHLLLVAVVLCAPTGGAVAGVNEALNFTLQTQQQDSGNASACAAVPAVHALRPPPAGASAACVTHWWVCGGHDFTAGFKRLEPQVGQYSLFGESQTNWGSSTSACGPELIVEVIGVEGRTVATEAGTTAVKIRREDAFDSYVSDTETRTFNAAGVAQPCGAVSTHSAQLFNARWSATAASGCAEDRAQDGLDSVDLLLQ